MLSNKIAKLSKIIKLAAVEKVFYDPDQDGKAAAAIIKTLNPNASFIAASYSDDFDLSQMVNDGDKIFIVDFSIDPDKMKDVLKRAEKVIWIDHHISAIKKYEDYDFHVDGIRDETKSAALLTWEFFYKDQKVPKAIDFINDFDTWQFKKANETKKFVEALNDLYDINPESDLWDRLLKDDGDLIKEILDKGEIAYKTAMSKVNSAISSGYEILYDGKIAFCVNTRGNGYFGDAGRKRGYDLIFCYYYNGNDYKFSVYSREDVVDCAEIAKKFGGGGHSGAAGFSVKELPKEFLKKYER